MANTIQGGMTVDGSSLAVLNNSTLIAPVPLTPVVPKGDVITANYTLVSGDGGRNKQNAGSTPLTVTPLSGVGNFQVSQTSTGSVMLVGSPENLVTYSEAFENAAWSGAAYTVTATTGVTDPNGNTNARTIQCTGSTSYLQITPTVSSGVLYNLSVWVQGVGSSVGKYITIGNYANNNRQQIKFGPLTSGWQYCNVEVDTVGTANQFFFIDLQDAFGANVGSGNSVNLFGAQMATLGKAYAQTTGTTVAGAYSLFGTSATSAAQPILNVVENPVGTFRAAPVPTSLTGTDITFKTLQRGPRRTASIVLGPVDSNPMDCDYVCTGSADDIPISNAINSLAYTGGKVVLRSGMYMLSSAINFDASWVTLEGEARGFWQGFFGAWSVKSLQGIPGGAQLCQTTSGANIITVNRTNLALNDGIRHGGIGFRNLYLYHLFGNAIGIYDSSNTDCSEISGCAFHNCGSGIDVNWDAAFIFNNTLQSMSGDAITSRFVFNKIFGNILYDIGGRGVVLPASTAGYGGHSVHGNTIGSTSKTTASAVVVTSSGNCITGNSIQMVNTGNAIDISGANSSSNVVTGNEISINTLNGIQVLTNNAAHGIYVHGGSTNNTIAGNGINQTNTGTNTGYAVALGLAGDATATGNTVVGNACTGTWNSAGAQKILDSSGGATNVIFGNGNSADTLYTARFGVANTNQIVGTSAIPTIAPQTGAGTSATASVVAGSTSLSGDISLTTGTASTAAGAQVIVTFAAALAATPQNVSIFPTNAAASALSTSLYRSALSTAGFTLSTSTAPPTGTTATWSYLIA